MAPRPAPGQVVFFLHPYHPVQLIELLDIRISQPPLPSPISSNLVRHPCCAVLYFIFNIGIKVEPRPLFKTLMPAVEALGKGGHGYPLAIGNGPGRVREEACHRTLRLVYELSPVSPRERRSGMQLAVPGTRVPVGKRPFEPGGVDPWVRGTGKCGRCC